MGIWGEDLLFHRLADSMLLQYIDAAGTAAKIPRFNELPDLTFLSL
jgi:hypothetical protein